MTGDRGKKGGVGERGVGIEELAVGSPSECGS